MLGFAPAGFVLGGNSLLVFRLSTYDEGARVLSRSQATISTAGLTCRICLGVMITSDIGGYWGNSFYLFFFPSVSFSYLVFDIDMG